MRLPCAPPLPCRTPTCCMIRPCDPLPTLPLPECAHRSSAWSMCASLARTWCAQATACTAAVQCWCSLWAQACGCSHSTRECTQGQDGAGMIRGCACGWVLRLMQRCKPDLQPLHHSVILAHLSPSTAPRLLPHLHTHTCRLSPPLLTCSH